MDFENLRAHSIQACLRPNAVRGVLAAALNAVDPAIAVRRLLERNGEQLVAGSAVYNLNAIRRIYLVGAGKASLPMAQEVKRIVGDRLSGGVLITKAGDPGSLPKIAVHKAGHPIPDERGHRATQEITAMLQSAGKEDLVICLISGGGSALMTCPASGLSLADLQRLTSLLLDCGADIYEINTLRKHLDTIKGGNLARHAHPARLLTLILSDVIGDPLEVIASGPTVPDPSTYQDAFQILKKYNLVSKTPEAILTHLQHGVDGQIPETPKHGDPVFGEVVNVLVGSNLIAARAAVEQAQLAGFNTVLLTTYLQGEARQAGRFIVSLSRQIASSEQPIPRPACIVVGGETTVVVKGNGLGGRNQEVALGAVADLQGLDNVLLLTLATDGEDGPSDAAGGVVTGETLMRGCQLKMQPGDYLERNDAYHFFEPLGDLIKTGPTLTNVNDLAIMFAF